MTLGIEGQFPVVSMRFRGIPFDVDYLQRCSESNPQDMLSGSIHGIGLRLIRQFSDRIEYRNLGKEGQEIIFLSMSLDEIPCLWFGRISADGSSIASKRSTFTCRCFNLGPQLFVTNLKKRDSFFRG